jgi:hypothetical protein
MTIIVATWPRERRIVDDDRVWLEIERAVRAVEEQQITVETLREEVATLRAREAATTL